MIPVLPYNGGSGWGNCEGEHRFTKKPHAYDEKPNKSSKGEETSEERALKLVKFIYLFASQPCFLFVFFRDPSLPCFAVVLPPRAAHPTHRRRSLGLLWLLTRNPAVPPRATMSNGSRRAPILLKHRNEKLLCSSPFSLCSSTYPLPLMAGLGSSFSCCSPPRPRFPILASREISRGTQEGKSVDPC